MLLPSVIVLQVLLSLVCSVDGSVKCFECIDMPHPNDCLYATTCSPYEQCYVEQFVSSGGLILYNSGCRAKNRCFAAGKRDVTNHVGLQKREDIVVCVDCCDGDFCNDNGCRQPAVQFPQRGLKCYNCKDVIHLSECRDLTICQDPGEVCMVHEIVSPDNKPRYETKCQRSLVCNALSNMQTSTNTKCVSCCNKDFCNTDCNGLSSGAQSGSSSSHMTGSGGGPSSNVMTTTATTTLRPTTKQPTLPTSPPVTFNPQAFCQEDGYVYFGFIPFCFKFHNEHKSRDEAQKSCEREQGQLAVINSDQKWDLVQKVFSKQTFAGSREFYIDGVYNQAQNNYICKGGNPCSINHWAVGLPDKAVTKACVFLNGTDSMKWYNGECADRRMFICSKTI